MVVATGAGFVYYYKDLNKERASNERRASKKERRRAKKEKEAAESRAASGMYSPCLGDAKLKHVPEEYDDNASKKAKVENEPAEDLPEVDETTVESLSEQVRAFS